ncbi:MAG: hypothetical protein D6785_00460 [Planctomycetota bacterium]|nr:MAG: hypothetical protein D6785_00460 [Planctomycetota bacterium]
MALLLGILVIGITLMEVWEFHKELQRSFLEDQKAFVQILKKASKAHKKEESSQKHMEKLEKND